MRKTENIINRTGINKTECKKTGHSKENKIPGGWNGSLFFLIIILGITLGIFAGCKNIFVPEPPATPEAAGPGGGITVSLRLFTGSARSVMPEMESLTWKITASQGDITISVAEGAYPEFSLSLPVSGTWTFTVRGINSVNDEIFTGSAEQNIESGSTTSISIPLSPGNGMAEGSGATGKLNLTIKRQNVNLMSLNYRIDGSKDWGSPVNFGEGDYTITYESLPVGRHTLDLYFSSNSDKGEFYFCTVAVNIWPGMTSDQWIKTNGEEYITDGGEFVITKEMVNEFVKTMGSVVFVNESVGENTPGTGSIYAPVNSVSKAVDILRKVNPEGKCNGTIMVSGEATIKDEIKVENGEKLTVKGMEADASIKNTSGRVFKITGGSLTLEENITLTGKNDAGNGGAVYVNGGTFTMKNDSKITGSSAQNGGGVYVNGGEFEMTGTAILQGNTATTHGGGVHIFSDGTFTGTFTMNGGTIDGDDANTATYGGGVFVSGGTFNMYGGTITGNTVTESGGGVCISGGTFTMSDGAFISGNTATSSGGGVFVSASGDFTMNGGTIGGSGGRNPNSAENGGGVYIFEGTFTMSDSAVISGNSATSSGGGVYVYETGEFTMEGGTIGGTGGESHNSAENGGGVYIYNGAFTMSDGSISGNTATDNGGGVFVQDGTFTLSGSPNISGNYRLAVDNINNVYLASGKTITIGAEGLTGGTIGVTVGKITAGDVEKITNENVSDADEIFTSDEARYAIVESSGAVYLSDAETKYVVTDGAEAFGAFTSALSAVNASGGTITLLKNIDGTNAVFGVGSVNNQPITFEGSSESISFILDLNGKTIDRKLSAAAIDGSVIKIEGGALTIKDSSAATDGTGGTGTITGGNSSNTGGGVYVEKDCTFIMNGGIISKNTTGKNGGGVYVNAGTFTMDGGTITENTAAENGGGVSVVKDGVNRGKFTMNGGAISGNTATQNGGGVNIADIFTMNGGTISGNKAGENGGGVNIGGGNFTMIGGTISGNTATQNGGGVYATLADTVADTGYFWLGEEGKTSSPVISGNKKADGTHNNAYLFLDNRNRYMNINGPLQKTKSLGNVGISMDNPGRFTINWTKNSGLTNPDFFFSDKEGYGITGEGGELKMAPLSEIP